VFQASPEEFGEDGGSDRGERLNDGIFASLVIDWVNGYFCLTQQMKKSRGGRETTQFLGADPIDRNQARSSSSSNVTRVHDGFENSDPVRDMVYCPRVLLSSSSGALIG
jgi:hypothetical protein